MTKYFPFYFIAFILSYLIMTSGLHGDDYTVINSFNGYSFWNFIGQTPDEVSSLILNPVSFYGLWWAYPLLGNEYQMIYDLIKILSSVISVYLIFRFFSDYLSYDRAIIASFIFVLYPLHDTTLYWYMTLQYILAPAILLYAHHLIRNNKIRKGFLVTIVGSFLSYASPPYLFGLTVIFLYEKKLKKAIVFVTPGILYVAYYFWMKFNYAGLERRINADLSILDFLKQMLIQPLSFLESAIGPSYWLKVFYAIESIGFISIIIIAMILIFSFIRVKSFSTVCKLPKSLYIGLISVLLLSFGMFALTGLYSHSAFNLGNRTTVYGSLFIAFLLAALLPANKKSAIFLLIIFLAPAFGLSDHWKNWNENQKVVIENIKNNQDLKEIESDSTLIITGNLYSKLGEYSHIEFFSMPWNVNAIFHNNTKTKTIVAITPYTEIREGYLVDPKFSGKYSLKNKLYVYDSEKNLVKSVSYKDVPRLIKQQPKIIRHWVQLFKNTWVQDIIVWLSPRLVYLFK